MAESDPNDPRRNVPTLIDAIRYILRVKKRFRNDPIRYNTFMAQLTNYRNGSVRIHEVIVNMKDVLYPEAGDLYLQFSDFLFHREKLMLLESLNFVQNVKTTLGAETPQYQMFIDQMLMLLIAAIAGDNNEPIVREVAFLLHLSGHNELIMEWYRFINLHERS